MANVRELLILVGHRAGKHTEPDTMVMGSPWVTGNFPIQKPREIVTRHRTLVAGTPLLVVRASLLERSRRDPA